jgi:hypothetical protein
MLFLLFWYRNVIFNNIIVRELQTWHYCPRNKKKWHYCPRDTKLHNCRRITKISNVIFLISRTVMSFFVFLSQLCHICISRTVWTKVTNMIFLSQNYKKDITVRELQKWHYCPRNKKKWHYCPRDAKMT